MSARRCDHPGCQALATTLVAAEDPGAWGTEAALERRVCDAHRAWARVAEAPPPGPPRRRQGDLFSEG